MNVPSWLNLMIVTLEQLALLFLCWVCLWYSKISIFKIFYHLDKCLHLLVIWHTAAYSLYGDVFMLNIIKRTCLFQIHELKVLHFCCKWLLESSLDCRLRHFSLRGISVMMILKGYWWSVTIKIVSASISFWKLACKNVILHFYIDTVFFVWYVYAMGCLFQTNHGHKTHFQILFNVAIWTGQVAIGAVFFSLSYDKTHLSAALDGQGTNDRSGACCRGGSHRDQTDNVNKQKRVFCLCKTSLEWHPLPLTY